MGAMRLILIGNKASTLKGNTLSGVTQDMESNLVGDIPLAIAMKEGAT